MTQRAEVPGQIVAELRAVCLALPESYEEPAWVGTRWRIRTRTFAHVLTIDAGWPPAYARAAESDGPVTVLTFESTGAELAALSAASHPFFKPRWRPTVVGMVLDGGVNWSEVAELVIESYCVLAPKKLVALVDRPIGD
ncbi:MAG TPA: MmcQ/YjbR family DNA-binding protein [Acidimicrobiia bacterium]|nr:MmcQ/YjbR family DNA-binding protein [Acidimicrobiia bacterium]